MIKALENPHFKKIWEEVNWKIRHPEAKSLEEALKLERKEPNNLLVAHAYGLGYRTFTSELYDEKNRDNGMARVEQILGRVITLEDILILLRGKNTAPDAFIDHYHINFAIWKDGETEFDCVKEWCFRVEPYSQDYHNMGAGFFWQLTKHLHEQSENTWEKISKLI